MSDLKDAAIGFEAVRYAMNQTKDGFRLTLVVHPSDMVADLMSHPIGTRYQVALVALNDQDEPVVPRSKTNAEQAVASAGMLCRDVRFQTWLMMEGLAEEISEAHAANAICTFCDIGSRSEIGTNPEALKSFDELRLRFSRAN